MHNPDSPDNHNGPETSENHGGLLGAADIRRIAAEAGVTPTKKFGQNFVIDPGTVRRIARTAGIGEGSRVMEVGPGLGSLTLAILETGATLTAVEIDPPLAERLPGTIAERMPEATERFNVINRDALKVSPADTPALAETESFTLVANLPYNVATPIIITLLEKYPNLDGFVVMVQKEVADRLTAGPGSKIYGTPSVKLQWFGTAEKAGTIGRNVFWPAPNVDSALVRFTRTRTDRTEADADRRKRTFALVDAAFAQRRKTLHAALKKLVPADAFASAGIDPTVRGETLTIDRFAALADAVAAMRTVGTGAES
ncbi:16S rRNA (adenine(1518)-N(6)/adenine(1519)-N(6))-dimethyltransferase RsmA [Bifidobacterium sp. 82T24]|uniref:16S rRNA (adenine(1518)-N(6)/adenine(1519)-N(6))- dimethyltransferase RsmA n=1 Tax=Bifidobacterium pluvialisilvae TaxID=2834436 RepID=UPI001C59F2D2|nr:16S rRNA (adenine(1518)-N(6)/adenine(1519)-N(6))-dimethyltransferase RsmA [Bifidobacterium pluvialisilvae]MBW3088654.1 16S rRNA (adenine(1518)-N(6)/adenine(1519)-N(6))-dimethyltransferase RsmA [Bifidobacterium pluvialisilvae]